MASKVRVAVATPTFDTPHRSLATDLSINHLGVSGLVQGLVLTLVLLILARPPAAMVVLAPFRVPKGERVFLAWAGMRGAVPILLASLALADGVQDANRVYGLVFVVVAASVVIQGATLPAVASALHVSTKTNSTAD
jgi:potassium/hydrogen antiporter